MWNISEVYTVFDWIFVHWDEFFETFLPGNLKKQISEALLGMHKLPAWSEKLEEWNIQQFTQVDESLYDLETNLMDVVKGLSLNSVYYWATHRHCTICQGRCFRHSLVWRPVFRQFYSKQRLDLEASPPSKQPKNCLYCGI